MGKKVKEDKKPPPDDVVCINTWYLYTIKVALNKLEIWKEKLLKI